MTRKDHTISLNESGFHYIDWGGSGPLTHMAHATGLCAGAYSKFVEKLNSQLRLIGLDFRGHGSTTAKADPKQLHNWKIFYDDFEDFLEYLQKPIISIGHSLGGTVSLKLAAAKPECFKALILIEPGIMPPSWRPWVFLAQKSGLSKYVPFVTRASKRKNGWESKQNAWDYLYGKGPFRRWNEEFLQDYVKDGLQESESNSVRLSCNPAWEGRCLAMAPYDIWRYVRDIKIPTLVLYGKLSTTFLPSVVKKLQDRIPNAVIKGFEKTGHFVPMEKPDETADIIIRFLEENNLLDHA